MKLWGVEDTDKLVKRYDEWYAGENHDRPLLNIASMSGKRRTVAEKTWSTVKDGWFDFDYRLDNQEADVEAMRFIAEGFPLYFANLGPDVLGAWMGGELEFREGTSWLVPFVERWEDQPPLKFDPQNPYWKAMEKFLGLSCERGRDKWLTGTGDLHGNADALSSLRRPENLCLDLIERPQEIHKRLQEVFEAWRAAVDATLSVIMPRTDGLTSGWLSALVRGRYVTLQNDFSCMVGPQMFREFFLEPMRREAAYLDRGIYHWDGPDAIKHLEALAEIEGLEVIQWTPGAGQKPMCEWGDLLKRVQDLGLGLWLGCEANDILQLSRILKPEKVLYSLWMPTPEEARTLVTEVERICARRRGA
jgi:hypothetical protein